ncbi:MAG: 2-octaprenyl-6-methoxyphenyl hydroxylase [Gammaproteobacteria bacterium]
MQRFDLIIAGAGPSGAALACALTPWFRRIALVDARPPTFEQEGQTDPRVLALANTSARILAGLGLWREVAKTATAIRQVRLFASDDPEESLLESRDGGFGALGFTVGAHALTGILHRHLRSRRVTWFAPRRIEGVAIADEVASLLLGDGERIDGRLLVAADGTRSIIRESLGIVSRDEDYRQQAILAELRASPPPEHTAFEVLTPGGPLALLPHGELWSMVWAQPESDAEALMALDEQGFARRVEQQLGGHLAVDEVVTPRVRYPLHRVEAWTLIGERTVLLGNAAHTVHPIGAQGLNLGFRDVATLAELLVQAVRAGIDPGDPGLLQHYAQRRLPDHRRVMEFTDTLAHLLSDDAHPLRPWLRTGLKLFRILSPLRSGMVKLGTGGFDRETRLGRGLPL